VKTLLSLSLSLSLCCEGNNDTAAAAAAAAADADDAPLLTQAYHVDGPRLEAAFRKYFYRPDSTVTHPTHQILVAHGNIFRFFTLR